jgi:hypothetical protein
MGGLMNVGDLLIDPGGGADAEASPWPLGFIDLDAWREPAEIGDAPFPLIGLGAADHPLASFVDVVVEPPIMAEGLIAQVVANPNAAAVAVQLLRDLEGVEVERALMLESLAYGLLQGSAEHDAGWRTARPTRHRLGGFW